jgi:AGZA family xanthine/uracil permease-like MFS transporter
VSYTHTPHKCNYRAQPNNPTVNRYRWATPGDLNAFFGLMLDNVADLVLMVSLLAATYDLPATFSIRYMVPGTALGVLIGDLAFTVMAFRLARRTGRSDITAMPLGLDTPSTFGMVFFVVGPAFLAAKTAGMSEDAAAHYAWRIGMCSIVLSGVFKLLCAQAAGWIRRAVPRAGLLGSLTAIALVLISFLPLLDILHTPMVGIVSLVVILTTLTARVALPGRVPGALGGLLIGGAIYYALQAAGWLPPTDVPFEPKLALTLPVPTLAWTEVLGDSLAYLPVVIPFALGTIVGGIDCTESAAAAGDEYDTSRVIAIEGIATLVAGCCGGIIQTTPYIGHPAYKAMGGRAAYTLATALFIGGAGIFGYFGHLYAIIPRPAIFPVLIFVGLEITAQSFRATPSRHYPAVALACVPAMAYLVMLFVDPLMSATGADLASLPPALAEKLQTVRVLSGGFIVTSLLWASALVALLERRLATAAGVLAIAALCSAFGVIHSPLPGSPLVVPWNLPALPEAAAAMTPLLLAAGYLIAAAVLLAWSRLPTVGDSESSNSESSNDTD